MSRFRRAQRWRVVLVVVTALLLAAAAVAGYARYEFVDRDAFADRVASSLDASSVRTVVADRVVSGLSENVAPEALVAAPLAVHGVAFLAGTPQFKRLFTRVARERHDALAEGRTSFVFELVPGAGALLETLRGLSPRLGAAIPRGLSVPVLALRPRTFEVRAARGISEIAGWFWPLLVAGLVLGLACAVLAGGLTAALVSVGSAIAGAGLVVALLVSGLGAFVVAHAAHALDLDEGTERSALHALWGSLFDDLRTAALLAALGGLVLAVLPAGELVARHLATAGARASALARSTRPAARRTRAVVLVGLGVGLVLEPGLLVRGGAALAGVLALAVGVSGLAGRRPPGGEARERAPAQPLLMGGAVAAVVAATAVATALVLPAPSSTPAAEAPEVGCNGSTALCRRPLNDVVFPATHNSYAAADERGWYFPNQRFGIERQLRDGIRGFLIDVHYGIRDPSSGLVRTPLQGEGSSRNKVAQQLNPDALRTADQLAGHVGARLPGGPRRLYLCHTLCELGSEPLGAQLRIFARFLATHRSTVLTLVVESYVSVADLERAMRDARLLDYAAELQRDEPLPTLAQLVETNKRLIVFGERDGGARPWYLPGFSFVQDTPYQATSARELGCRRYRGTADSPLFLVNHWVAAFPPSPRPNRRIGGRILRRRLARCERERRLRPNLVAVDFYERSGVIPIARALNARPAAP